MIKNTRMTTRLNLNRLVNQVLLLSRKGQQGFALVMILILSSLASILVLTSLKDNVNQERLSGNFQKQLNARLVTERGVIDAIAKLKQDVDDDQAITIEALITRNVSGINGEGELSDTEYKVSITKDSAGFLTLASEGSRYEALSHLSAKLKLVPGAHSQSPFNHAVLGCEGVSMGGSSQVDSFDFTVAAPRHSTPGTGGDVATLSDSGDIMLNGTSPIYGNVFSPGKSY